MKEYDVGSALEHKFCKNDALPLALKEGAVIEGYASVFGAADFGGDIVQGGAYAASLRQIAAEGRRVKMLWQHDPSEPIGVWDEVREDARGLYVKGRILTDVTRGREAAALVAAGALDGLSIGYRTKRASKDASGHRLLAELELWEVSLVTFPMLADARVGTKAEESAEALLRDLADAFAGARRALAEG
ncbi:HK97 family phage prohead protease [Rhodovulum sulfidophilum]|uniref:HK97 family phage prohead protease n=2 Tax=root TaxID=1 RepID=A0A0D6B5B5_RHOSU|nr:HK97 family phage prohead protease [Rhodovulum sulfidophilum]DBA12245.1 TPA_asm: HK97 family phage prohead protease [Rhodovulugtaviriform kikuchii]ANB34222.1 peptidase U35 [Rhodovulum sulfidophilum DSM 1374]ANB38045.1 peptidase U35 [Rhodovulum sulfidophilum]MBK5924277.1 peptidase U35 [Rhodovulum sulfidophilum]MBL3552544.1 HK97 family phage prohead protease [Rhodovulum sulfidophilum]